MTCAIEDAGFEIRDCIQWLYSQGFPKSHDISKAIDKKLGAERQVVGVAYERNGKNGTNNEKYAQAPRETTYITAPATPEAQQWDGWGTALKPANEPIVLARKPISEKTIAENVMKWGTGGLNIDGCRIGGGGDYTVHHAGSSGTGIYQWNKGEQVDSSTDYYKTEGRFPANVILDEEAGQMLDEQSGITTNTRHMSYKRSGGEFINGIPSQPEKGWFKKETGGASRFFYCAKASKKERNMGLEDIEPTTVDDGRNKPIDNPFLRGKTPRRNTHPTVKPVKLMEYLITLITPPNGIVLDPFLGSGTTALAALNLGRFFIGIEFNEEYCEIARRRIEQHKTQIERR